MFEFILLSLACWRISFMLTVEDGPWNIFQKIRDELVNFGWSPLVCFNCTSVWVGLVLSILAGHLIIYALAISAVAIITNLILEG